MPINDVLRLVIERLSTDGRGVARLPEGKVVFVAGALPGESVDALLTAEKKDYAEARLAGAVPDIGTPSPLRATPPCPHFLAASPCGGCDIQHISASEQSNVKRQWLLETLRRVGRWSPEALSNAENILRVEQGASVEYRQRIRLHADRGVLGFHGRQSNRVIAVSAPACLVAHEAIRAALPALQKAVAACRFTGEVEVTVEGATGRLAVVPHPPRTPGHDQKAKSSARDLLARCKAEGVPLFEGPLVQMPHPFLPTFSVHREGFVQPHRNATPSYAQTIEGWIFAFLQESAQQKNMRSSVQKVVSWDLYAGSGPLSALALVAGDRAGVPIQAIAVEGFPQAAQAIERNSPHGKTIEAITADVHQFLSEKPEIPPAIVVADPPRAGMGTATAQALADVLAPQSLCILVACSPAAFARDAQVLLASGLSLSHLVLFDMFAQTAHYEVVAAFRKAPAPQA